MTSDAIAYLRQSDFRDEADRAGALEARADELRDLGPAVGVPRESVRVVVENDLDGNGRLRGASAHKRRDRVATASGLVTFRTRRPHFHGVLLDLQAGGGTLLVADESRITRDHRDGYDLLDACQVGKASVVALDDEGGARWLLTDGGTRVERAAFLDRVNDAYKFSVEHGAKIRRGRRRWAGKSWHGGPRPYGYQIREGTEEYRRNLDADPAEAAVLDGYADRLLAGTSLRVCLRELRERQAAGEPGCDTVGGGAWSGRSLRDVLIKPATAGLQRKGGALVGAPWTPIIEREKWERLRALLLDPARRTTDAGNEPRHLVSSFATCGVCGGLLRIGGAGRGRDGSQRGQAYVGAECGHVRRDAAKVDELVAETALRYLERPEFVARMRPPARTRVDAAGLTAELRGLADRRAEWQHRAATGADPDFVMGILAQIEQREAAIHERLAVSDHQPDVLARFREEPARTVWDAMDLSLRRAVIQRVFASVVVNRAGRGSRFDPAAIDMRVRLGG